MKGVIFLAVNLAVFLSIKTTEQQIVEIGEDKDITEANKDSGHDDILEPPSNLQRSSITDVNDLWESPVPYVLDDSLEMNAKGVIMRAFDQFRLKSCIDFKPRDSEDYYFNAQKLGGCYSYVGKVITNGQDLSIGRYCDSISTVEHEFLHGLGFYHEQSRYDRDDYVTIAFENIQQGFASNFRKTSKDVSSTQGVPYDYYSVMHYSQYAFSNGNGTTIVTKDPDFQDEIGQRLEMSPSDVLELNRLYKCNSTIAFQMHCNFSDGNMCGMDRCSRGGSGGWEMATSASGGPSSDHTNLPSGLGHDHEGNETGHFMHASTESGVEGDSSWLETHRMSPNRDCHIQCLQFYYFHNGSTSDQLNIWIREFRNERDLTGTLRLMGQITGQPTSHWQLKHVSLNATSHFQVEFEVRKGAGVSTGGFSIDDINLSELECPHVAIQVDDFENLLKTSAYGTSIQSKRQFSRGGYAYTVGIDLLRSYVGMFVQLLSSKTDKSLEWPLPQRQVTFMMLDQDPNIQRQMSKQSSITSDKSRTTNGNYTWGNPRETGTPYTDDESGELIFAGPKLGKRYFASLDTMDSWNFLKGGSAVFLFDFQDLTPVLTGNNLPCPKLTPAEITNPPKRPNNGPCSAGITPTTTRPAHTTTEKRKKTTTHPLHTTTDDTKSTRTVRPPKTTTDDKSIFGLSPGLVASPVLIVMVTLMALIR